MNRKDCEKQLKNCLKPCVDTECHRNRLKNLLLSSHRGAYSNRINESVIDKVIDLVHNTPHSKTLLTSSMLVVLVVAVTLGFGLAGQNNTAQATEIVHRALNTVASLPPEERAAIEARLSGDLIALLEEAYESRDLEFLGLEQGNSMFAAHYDFIPPATLNATSDEYYYFDHDRSPATVKLLRYTNPQGYQITLGVDEYDRPVIRYANY